MDTREGEATRGFRIFPPPYAVWVCEVLQFGFPLVKMVESMCDSRLSVPAGSPQIRAYWRSR